MAAANAAMLVTNGVVSNENVEAAAFNLNDNLNQKYNVSVGAIRGSNIRSNVTPDPANEVEDQFEEAAQEPQNEANSSKKRHFNEITQISLASIPQRRPNPFAKETRNGSGVKKPG